MHLCYFDESGCVGALPSSTSPVSPLLVIAAVAFDSARLRDITLEFLELKRRYFRKDIPDPGYPLSRIKAEIKGADIRRILSQPGGRNPRRPKEYFLSDVLALLEKNNARIWGRVWVKEPGQPMNGVSVYTSSVQSLYANFQNYLEVREARGCVIGDSREAAQNVKVAHSIFTKKYSHNGDCFDRIVELPSFANSQNTVGLQLADLICSAVLFPMGIETYCKGHINSLHVRDYSRLKSKFADRVSKLQHRYIMPDRRHQGTFKKTGGIVVSDAIRNRPGHLMFQIPQRQSFHPAVAQKLLSRPISSPRPVTAKP